MSNLLNRSSQGSMEERTKWWVRRWKTLGIILRMEGKEGEAQKTFKQAMTVFEKALGLKHPRARKCKQLIQNGS